MRNMTMKAGEAEVGMKRRGNQLDGQCELDECHLKPTIQHTSEDRTFLQR